jgi:hypothetical protein
MAVVTADYWVNLHRPTIGLRSAAEHTDRWATSTQPFALTGASLRASVLSALFGSFATFIYAEAPMPCSLFLQEIFRQGINAIAMLLCDTVFCIPKFF